MGLRIGKVTGHEIKKNRDGLAEVLLLQVEVSGPDDIQTIEWYQASGQDSSPPLNSLVAFFPAGQAWMIALGANDGIIPTSDPGEHKIYSSAGGVVKAFFKLFNTGLSRLESLVIELFSSGNTRIEAGAILQLIGNTVEINNGVDFAVRFSVLQAQFALLVADLNSHKHSGGVIPDTPSTANIALAKVTEVKLP